MLPPLDAAHPTAAHPVAAELTAVSLGGAIGASLRHAVYAFAPIPDLEFVLEAALETLAINLVGALCLGLLYGLLSVRGGHPLLRPFLGIGVLGSFTTYSTFVLEFSVIGREDGHLAALALILGSLFLGVAAYQLGHHLATGPKREKTR
ncbi:MAG: CrcB family protein [bacterium]|nr:fluoride efflux transporter CrcB [Deltaproteobacteria bacterium]MCP4907706.1 CrcB family protein [bacterium]